MGGCVPLIGIRQHKEICIWNLPDTLCVHFPYDPSVYPYYIAVRNLSHKYNNKLTSVISSSECPNVEVIFGYPWQSTLCKTILIVGAQ